MKTIQTFILLVFVTLLFTASSFSQYKEDAYRLSYLGTGIGARSLGLGTAYTGIADDFTAVYWNPAGLGQIENNEISGGLSHFSYENDNTFLGKKESFSSSATNLDNIGLVYPFPAQQGHLVFAIGYGRQSDFTTALAFSGFNSSITGRTSASYPDSVDIATNILESGGMNNWIIAGAIEAERGLFIGASLNFISGSYTYNRDFVGSDPKNLYYMYQIDRQYSIDEDIGGVTGRIGLLYETRNQRGRIGLNIKFPSYLSLRDDWSDVTNYYDDIPDSDYTYKESGYSEFDLVTPFVFSAGISWTFGDLLLAGSVDYTDWTQMEFKNTYTELMQENTVIKEKLKSTVNLRLGAEFAVPTTDISVRAGFAYLPSPFKFQSSTNAQKYITGGLGWKIEDAIRLDIGYAYGFWDTAHEVNYDPGYTDNYPATTSEKIRTHTVLASLMYRF